MIITEYAKAAIVERFRRAPFADKVTASMLADAAAGTGMPRHEALTYAIQALPFLVDYRRRRTPRPEDRPRARWNYLAEAWRAVDASPRSGTVTA